MRARPTQPDLLDWTPPAATVRFEDRTVRAASLAATLSKAVSTALRDSKIPREEIAARMSQWLGEDVTKNMLDAYASEAREDHVISLPRFMALLHATEDRRLLELLAEPLGWAVIERRYLPLIELASVQGKIDELRRHGDHLHRLAKRAGGL